MSGLPLAGDFWDALSQGTSLELSEQRRGAWGIYNPTPLDLAPGDSSPLNCHTPAHTHARTHACVQERAWEEMLSARRMSTTGASGFRWAKEYERGHQQPSLKTPNSCIANLLPCGDDEKSLVFIIPNSVHSWTEMLSLAPVHLTVPLSASCVVIDQGATRWWESLKSDDRTSNTFSSVLFPPLNDLASPQRDFEKIYLNSHTAIKIKWTRETI